ncbi:predicted protein [Naegleria gruberi]|uniref:Predicted protein n=1 Tax=Naegleria gruberi TaxID=5762 RepID=D2UYC2_NAEGR|nr:uncharacterized protein NAEGRDRAFT_61421 [Naegleria gruberi]EFC50766.1 predicted protein [Naegleria gruberi]|eukprot:XP_002683510.1 predicted protein [Naegleria gruberi strain NEG-M]
MDGNKEEKHKSEEEITQNYISNLLTTQSYFSNAPVLFSNKEYVPEKPCQDLLQLFAKCEREYQNNKPEIMCAEFKESYLDCRRQFNSLKKEIEEENLVRSKVLYFYDKSAKIVSASDPQGPKVGQVKVDN